MLNVDDAAQRIAAALHLVGQVGVAGATRFAVGVGLTTGSMVSLAALNNQPRNSVSLRMNNAPVRVEPDETMSFAALDQGANEAAMLLAQSLIRAFQNTA
ncbi:hypothetical protein [Paenarthrobacter sp. PH39-S1]|uniref:hypothetical protein n=1 Tax=Paenarthrobacter sp. PH39-S1 TaxID=3046204 RepID=UPI0024B8E89C|nr:hypothetical protein [Paenarthrobacter sp. PH39-S1]MDJ0356340.1 hypothetical protein [Paenarthrobacter sp. PH39-S1]